MSNPEFLPRQRVHVEFDAIVVSQSSRLSGSEERWVYISPEWHLRNRFSVPSSKITLIVDPRREILIQLLRQHGVAAADGDVPHRLIDDILEVTDLTPDARYLATPTDSGALDPLICKWCGQRVWISEITENHGWVHKDREPNCDPVELVRRGFMPPGLTPA